MSEDSKVINLVSSELEYRAKKYNHSQPFYFKVNPQSGGSSLTPLVSSPVGPVSFQLPARPLILSKSYLALNLKLTAEASKFLNLQGIITSMINRVSLSVVGANTNLVDLNFASNYCDSMTPYATSYEEFMDKPASRSSLVESSATVAGYTPIEEIACANTAIANTSPINWTTGAGLNCSGSNITGYGFYYDSPRYIYYSETVNTDEYISIRIPMSAFKLTALNIEQLMYFGGLQLQLDFWFEAGTKWAFSNITTSNRPDLTPAQVVSATLGTNAISGITFYTYVEQNPEVSQVLMDKVAREGIQMPIPIVNVVKQNLSSGACSLVQPITNAWGNRLLFVAWTGYNNTETGATAKDHTVYPFLSTSYQTMLDGVPNISNGLVNVNIGEHYMFNKENIDGSCITNQYAYNQQFVHFDNWTGMSISELAKNASVICGRDLSAQKSYSLNVTNAGSQLNYYVYVITQRLLTITSGNVVVSNY